MEKFFKHAAGLLSNMKARRLELLTMIIIVVPMCFWISRKEGYHLDEMLSYEFANAEYNPWIVPIQPEGRLAKFMREEIRGEDWKETIANLLATAEDVWENRGNSVLATFKADVYEEPVWIDRQKFHEYITVNGQDAFNYLSVYFNVKGDVHPPLYYMALHTVSSLFQGRVSPWMGCMVNLLAVAGVCVLLMAIVRMLYGDGNYGIMAALLYGMSGGAIATVLLTRMYGVVTFFCISTLYFHLKKWKEGNWGEKNRLLITVTVLGFLSQYFFLFYAIGLALVTIVSLWAKKEGKAVFFYIRSMCIAAVIGVGLFPFAISHVLSSDRGVEVMGNLSQGLNGYGERLLEFGKILTGHLSGGAAGTVIFLLFAVVCGYICKRKKKEEVPVGENGEERKGKEGMPVAALLIVPFIIYFLIASKVSPYLVDRYIMPIFPVAVLLIICAAKRCGLRGKIGMVCALILGIFSVAVYDGGYLYMGYENQVEIARRYRNMPCVCVYEGYGYYENLIEFREYRETLLVKEDELKERGEDDVLEGAEQIIVMVKSEVDQEQLKELLWTKYGYAVSQELLSDSVHQDSIWLCTK